MASSGRCRHSRAMVRIFVRDPADRTTWDGNAVDILNMCLNVVGDHPLGVHGQNLLLNVLADAGLLFGGT